MANLKAWQDQQLLEGCPIMDLKRLGELPQIIESTKQHGLNPLGSLNNRGIWLEGYARALSSTNCLQQEPCAC